MSRKSIILLLSLMCTFMLKTQNIIIDGISNDWKNVPIISEPGEFPYAKVQVSGDSLLYMMQLSPIAPEANTQEINYTPDNVTIFPNPERGFYKHTESILGSSGSLNENTLRSYMKNDNIALILRVYYLTNFKSAALSSTALQRLDTDMDVLRKAGLKCILRFAYTNQMPGEDAPLEIVKQHLDQLAPYFVKHADVIAFMQAGFAGPWGEWHSSSNNLTTPAASSEILNKILACLPADRMVQVRTPNYKQRFLDRTTALTNNEGFDQSKVARIGHHNDCFMASVNDYGTYKEVEIEKAYLHSECLYVPSGGETCPPSGIDPADCTKAQQEMRFLRWTYLNDDYYRGVNDQWIVQGCMDNIKREMGYRFQLKSGVFTRVLAPGAAFNARIIIQNSGYAPLYNKRNIELILRNNQNNMIYVAKIDTDPRLWQPLTENLIDVTIGIPANIPSGTYSLLLNLPDAYAGISNRPEYAVRFANQQVWEASTGYNNLLVNINIDDNTAETGTYQGEHYFMPE